MLFGPVKSASVAAGIIFLGRNNGQQQIRPPRAAKVQAGDLFRFKVKELNAQPKAERDREDQCRLVRPFPRLKPAIFSITAQTAAVS